jgi:HSP20 family protein
MDPPLFAWLPGDAPPDSALQHPSLTSEDEDYRGFRLAGGEPFFESVRVVPERSGAMVAATFRCCTQSGEIAMNLTRWEPFKEAESLFRQFGLPSFGAMSRLPGGDGASTEWSPAADISESESEYVVRAELAGVPREAAQVSVEDGVLTIQGERKQESRDEKSHRIERFYGGFCRSFALPDNADAEHIRAEARDGVLSVHVPKLKVEKKSSPVQIKVE